MPDMKELIPNVLKSMEAQVRKDIIKFDGCYPAIQYAADLKEDVIERALNGYAKGCKREDVVAICAMEAKGEKGILLSTKGMYNSWTIEDGNAPFTPILYEKVNSSIAHVPKDSRLTISGFNLESYDIFCPHTLFCSYVLDWTASKIRFSRIFFPKELFHAGDLTTNFHNRTGPVLVLYVSPPYLPEGRTDPSKEQLDVLLFDLKRRTMQTFTEAANKNSSLKLHYEAHTGEYIGAGLFIDYQTQKIVDTANRPAVYQELKKLPIGTIAQLYETLDRTYFGFAYQTVIHERLCTIQNGQFLSLDDHQPVEKSLEPDWLISLDESHIYSKSEISAYAAKHTQPKTFRVSTADGILIWGLEDAPVNGKILTAKQLTLGTPVTVWREVLPDGQKKAVHFAEVFAETSIEFPKLQELSHHLV